MADYWTRKSGDTLAVLQERVTTTLPLPLQEEQATIAVIGGKLPGGLRLDGSSLVGTPFEVARDTTSQFVLRATYNNTISDRTYKIVVQGADEPNWQTAEDLLPVGKGDAFFVLDNQLVDFQLQAIDNDLAAGQQLEYFIGSGDGVLPPGLTLSKTGKITGIVDPILALTQETGNGGFDTHGYGDAAFDFAVKSDNGYESFFYDSVTYDTSTPTRSPKKLNRYYEFTVSVSDGDVVARRTFRIFVVGDDFLRADNTVMLVGTGTFTADNTFIRTPIWLTPGNLGYKRANNYITLFLDVIDSNLITGVLSYQLLSTNDDGSPSVLPEGLTLDSSNGEIAGRVGYQPSVTKIFKFTIRAKRSIGTEINATFKDKTFTLTLLGDIDSNLSWVTNTDLGTINSNYISTLNVKAVSSVPSPVLFYTLESGRLPPGLTLSLSGEIVGKVNSFGSVGNDGLTVFDNNTFTLDGNVTTVDRKYRFTVGVQDQFAYSKITKEFAVGITDPDDKVYSNLYFKPFLSREYQTVFDTFIGDPSIFLPDAIYRPDDKFFGLQGEMKMLMYAGLETKSAPQYVSAIAKNHTRKNLLFGEVKTALAKTPGTNDIVYEVVYVEIVDPQDKKGMAKKIKIRNSKLDINQGQTEANYEFYDYGVVGGIASNARLSGAEFIPLGTSLEVVTRTGTFLVSKGIGLTVVARSGEISVAVASGTPPPDRFRPNNANTIKADTNALSVDGGNDNVRYISNISNMRDNLKQVGVTENAFLPLWMRTAQAGSVAPPGFTPAIPLCFCRPGRSKDILLRIQNANFKFNQFNFDVDRYIIDSTTGSSNESYIPFQNYKFNV
tara:strand:- start:4737 stop:7238 length:2502 start_codon:yes stop_codon:yes gene_type:complete